MPVIPFPAAGNEYNTILAKQEKFKSQPSSIERRGYTHLNGLNALQGSPAIKRLHHRNNGTP
jgi:hypothetical protein